LKVEIKVDSSCEEPKNIVVTNQVTEEVQDLVQMLSAGAPQMLVGFQEDQALVLEHVNIIRVFSSGGKVYAETQEGKFILRLRLYELEERVCKGSFARISNSEIINLRKVKKFDLSLTGTICVSLSNGATTYVSRRYVSKIKKILGI
jgi:DNA-binding LytR/AlgR family response regulator